MDPCSSNEALRRDIPSSKHQPKLPLKRPRAEKGNNFLKIDEVSEIEEPELVKVYLRMKPCQVPNNLYEIRSDKCLLASLDTTIANHGRRTQHNVSKMYTFSRIFQDKTTQKEVFNEVVKDNLKRLVDGHSFTLLTYGASGSGKTHTMMGTVNSPGLVPRALEYLFKLVNAAQMPILKPSENGTEMLGYEQQNSELQWVKRLLQVSAPFREKYRRMSTQLQSDCTINDIDLTNRIKYYVWVSFVEIYNEAVYDLLAPPNKRVKLRFREDSTGNVYVKGVTQAFVRSGAEAYGVMVAGKHNLAVGATGIHAGSSRSHCIFTITMLTEKDGKIRASHVRLCDLAGSERQRAARCTGIRMTESRAIGSSLHVLERCLHMLRRKQLTGDTAMVPYRESKLTRLLGTGLSGAHGEAVTMVVTVNPVPEYAHETRHVLSMAVVARDIHINNVIDPKATTSSSQESSQDSTTSDLADEVLRTENARLKIELAQSQTSYSELLKAMYKYQQETDIFLKTIQASNEMRVFQEEKLTGLQSQIPARESNEDEKQDVGEHIERDANEYKEKESTNSDLVYSTDSDNGCDSESLEPFNQLRKSIVHTETSHCSESLEEESENDESDNDMNNDDSVYGRVKSKGSEEPKESLADNVDATSKESLYATGDEDSEIDNQSRQIENAIDSTADLTQPAYKINNKDATTAIETGNKKDVTFVVEKNKNDPNKNGEQDKNKCEELFNMSTKLNEAQDVRKYAMLANLRETYFVINVPQTESDVGQVLKTLNVVRGTDFDALREISFYKETDIENGNDEKKVSVVENKESPVKNKESPKKNKESPTKFVTPKNLAETYLSKIKKSFKTGQSSASSLNQFEQLELAINKDDNSTSAVQGKRYFDVDTTAEEIDELDEEQNIDGKSVVKQLKYLEDKPDKSSLYQLSNAAKVQAKRLLFDSLETSPSSPEKQNKSNSDTTQSLVITPKIVKEAQLYYTENDKIIHNDVLIPGSPSILTHYSTQGYEPSISLRKNIGETFPNPEILSSACKERLSSKKHKSVDIFESPLQMITKNNSKENSNIEKTADKNAEHSKDNINVEITSVVNLKEKGKEIAYQFVEHLIVNQKIKTCIKKEKLESAKSSVTKESTENEKHENPKQNKQKN